MSDDGVEIGRIVITRTLDGNDDIIEVTATVMDGSPMSAIERLGMLELAKGYLIQEEESTDHED